MRRLFYLLREAWANMRANRTTTVVAILTTAFTPVSYTHLTLTTSDLV